MRSPLRCGLVALPLTLLLASCSRQRQAVDATLPLPVEIRADTGQAQVLDVHAPPQAHVWVARVAPVRASPLELEVPDAPPDSVISPAPPPMLEIDDNLKPPILKSRAILKVPPSYGRQRSVQSVELDVRVDEFGEVTDALWAGGSNDSALVQNATECALRMRFYPALQSGQPVPVWCRHRFDFGGGSPPGR